MSQTFSPHLDILPAAQRILWDELRQVPMEFTLYGGTAIALRLGHRQSLDFDFFSSRAFDPDVLTERIPFLLAGDVIQKEENTLTVIVDRGAPVQTSFFGVPRLGQVLEPEQSADTGVRVAMLLDLAATKLAVVQKRAEARDYVDIDAILESGAVDLPTALAGAKSIYGHHFNPQISLKALAFFDDGTLPQLAQLVKNRLAAAVASVDLSRLPGLSMYRARPEQTQ
jgi:hypothetical protein